MPSRSLWRYCNGMKTVDHVITGMQIVICKTSLSDLAEYSSKHYNKNKKLKNLAQYRTILYGIILQIWVNKTHHVLTINNNLLSQMRQFSTGFHEWNSHEWKLLVNRLIIQGVWGGWGVWGVGGGGAVGVGVGGGVGWGGVGWGGVGIHDVISHKLSNALQHAYCNLNTFWCSDTARHGLAFVKDIVMSLQHTG